MAENVVDIGTRKRKAHPNSKKQITTLAASVTQLRGVANALEERFAGEIERTCTPELAAEHTTQMSLEIARIQKVTRALAKRAKCGGR